MIGTILSIAMKTVLLDSSIWLSYLGADAQGGKAEKLLAQLKNQRTTILVPMDLLILAFAFEFRVNKLYSFDRKLTNAYKLLTQS